MDIRINRLIDFLYESASLLLRHQTSYKFIPGINNLDIISIFEYNNSIHNLPEKEADTFFREVAVPIADIISKAISVSESISESDLQEYFFPVFLQGRLSVSDLICEAIRLLDMWKKEYHELNSEEKQLLALSLLNNISSLENISEPLPDFITAAEEALTENSEKWLFLKTIYSLDMLIPKIQTILSPLVLLLKENEDILQRIHDFVLAQIEKHIEQDAISYLKDTWNLIPEENLPLIIEIRLMRFSELSFFRIGDTQILSFGICCPIFSEYNKNIPQDLVTSMLKALGDKRRMEIIRLLKQKPHYGNELAEKLKITPATISHHMDILIQNRLIVIEHDSTRLIYSINTNSVSKLLAQLKETLL
jgi:Predicted transcriptional regulators